MVRWHKTMWALAALTFTACNSTHKDQTSQVVAQVNGAEITVSQLGAALQSKGAEGATPQVAKQAIDALIDEQLLVKEALDNKLDRDPAVVQAIEHARRQVLLHAYVDRMVFPKETISASDQIAYYKAHPELFEKRRVYQVVAYVAEEARVTDAVKAELAKAHTPEAIRASLETHKVPHDEQSLTRSAEQLPLDALPRFAAAGTGDVIALAPQEGRYSMMLITGIQESPITVDKAQPIIQQYLVNVRNSRAMQEHLKHARAVAKIEYFGNVSDAATQQIAGQLQNATAAERDNYARKSAAVLD